MNDEKYRELRLKILRIFAEADGLEDVDEIIIGTLRDYLYTLIVPSLSLDVKMKDHKRYLDYLSQEILSDLERLHKGVKLHDIFILPEESNDTKQ